MNIHDLCKDLYTDSTHIKAKANKHKNTLVTVEVKPKEYRDPKKFLRYAKAVLPSRIHGLC